MRSMNKEAIERFLTPDWKSILIFVMFFASSACRSYTELMFSGKDMGLPKPLLFDLLALFPFWVVWVILLLPLGMLSNVIVAIGGHDVDLIMRGSFWLSWGDSTAVSLRYFVRNCFCLDEIE